ncbi:putative nitrate/nitrite DNA-binding response regulator [unidentified eubacterium SCB49]|nr:putative nitrate/nitrite DNA-binding response regulator [unidentified eubacterium SCB49]
MKNQIKILVADDHPLLLKGLLQELQAAGYNTTGANNSIEALNYIAKNDIDIAILDIEMPDLNGFEIIKKAKTQENATKFIILTSHKEKGFVVSASKLNISGYLLKDEPFSEINRCIKAVLKGDTYFSTTFTSIFNHSIAPELNRLKLLSSSEKTIIKLVTQKKSTKDIAEILSISPRTVDKHRSNIIDKLGLMKGIDSLSIWTQENKEIILLN